MSRTLVTALALFVSTSALAADDDVCKNTTIVVNSGDAITAEEFCSALAGHRGGFAVYNTQCFGGGIIDCCVSKGIKGFYGSGGGATEKQRYGQYDNGTSGAVAPGANTGDVHNAGAGNTNADHSTPQSSGVPSTIPPAGPGAGQSHAVFFAGKPTGNAATPGQSYEDGHNSSIETSFGDANTTTMMGDGSEAGEDPATKANLLAALGGHTGQFLVIYIDDHGNSGKSIGEKVVRASTIETFQLDLGDLLFQQAMDQADSNPLLFVTSDQPLPNPFFVDVNGYRLRVDDSYVDAIEMFGQTEYRAEIPIPHARLEQVNNIMMFSRRDMVVDITLDVEVQKPLPEDGDIIPPIDTFPPTGADVRVIQGQYGVLLFEVMLQDPLDFPQWVHSFDVSATCARSSEFVQVRYPMDGPMDVLPVEVCPGDEILHAAWSYSSCSMFDGSCLGLAYGEWDPSMPQVRVP